ncbi:hypothetical protein GCM10010407_06800 [Rarobacter incanus]
MDLGATPVIWLKSALAHEKLQRIQGVGTPRASGRGAPRNLWEIQLLLDKGKEPVAPAKGHGNTT